MRNSALQERRNRQILADIVRAYIETGEPVSSRVISKGFEETLSTATIRNVMADLEDAGFLYQPHTSAGRVPTAAAYRFFAQEIASQATIPQWTANGSSGKWAAPPAQQKSQNAPGMCWRRFPTASALLCRRRWARLFWNTRGCGCCRTAAW